MRLGAVGVLGEPAGVGEALGEQRVGDPEQQQRVGAGPDEVVLGGLAGGAASPRVDDHHLAAALADRADAPAHVGRGQQRAVGDQRVGAEDQQVVGAVDVRDRHREPGAEHQPGRDLLGHLVDRRGRVDVLRSPARARTPARRSWARGCGRSGCPDTRRPRRGRPRPALRRGRGRPRRTPRPSSPRPARRRGGRAAWSAGRGRRGAGAGPGTWGRGSRGRRRPRHLRGPRRRRRRAPSPRGRRSPRRTDRCGSGRSRTPPSGTGSSGASTAAQLGFASLRLTRQPRGPRPRGCRARRPRSG